MNTKFLKAFSLALALFSGVANAQIKTNNGISATIANESVFLDASSFPVGTSSGKGLNFPRTNLTTFTFTTATTSALKFPTAYDGLVVYNTATGTTITGTPVAVTPGFYYFKNTGATTNSTTGVWTAIGGSSKVDIATAETATNTSIAGATVYAIKGSFTATANNTAITLAAPTGITSMYRITIYKDGAVFGTSLYSYNKATGAAYTGSPGISVVYPAGSYDYVLEYFK